MIIFYNMQPIIIFAVIGLVSWIIYEFFIKAGRNCRKRLALAAPFPDEWTAILKRNIRFYQKLPPAQQDKLREDIKIFIYDKSFEGCGGLSINDEIKVTIAAQACLLLANRDSECYPKLHTIIVYPHTYLARESRFSNEKPEARSGESWDGGTVVLSWNSVIGGASNFQDGHNVAMHEFAHQLDQENGAADGAPILEKRSAYSAWAKTLSREYEQLQQKTAEGRRTVMSSYGATNPAEFFAVATETFFEKPVQLLKNHPELYEELKNFYHLDPIEWTL